jgi:uncharacterized protein YigE (DUF2233 family)
MRVSVQYLLALVILILGQRAGAVSDTMTPTWACEMAARLCDAGWAVENHGGKGGHPDLLAADRIIHADDITDTLVITAVVFRPGGLNRVTIVTEEETGKLGITGEDAAASLLASPFSRGEGVWGVVLINGGFFDKKNRPMGLLRVGGKNLNTAPRGGGFLSNGYFAMIGGSPVIQEFGRGREGLVPEKAELVLQSGPLLVCGSKVHKSVRRAALTRSSRSAIGLDRFGNIWMVVVRSPLGGISLREMALMLVRPLSRGGLGLSNAMNLDGGSSTQMFLKTAGREMVRRGDGRPLPAWIAVVFP